MKTRRKTLKELKNEIHHFTSKWIKPDVEVYDRQEAIPETLIQKLGQAGYLGFSIPKQYSGQGASQLELAILNQEIGKACSSTRSLLTVHLSLVAETILRWGTEEQKETWLPSLATGKKIAAFCLSEPSIGSDAKNIQSAFQETEQGYLITGVKKWITFGQRADVFLFCAQQDGKVSAFLVDRHSAGVEVVPIKGVLGTRASMLAEVHLNNCFVPKENLLGRDGWGFLQIVNTALDNGRFSVANGSLGIAKACLEDSLNYAKTRKQFDVFIKEHQLIKQKITEMTCNVKAASLLCENSAKLRDAKDPDAFIHTTIAKYFSSRIANCAAKEAVQIHGANGCHDGASVQRYFRDAKIMEIIEGSSEIQQIVIADQAFLSLKSIIQ